MKGIEIEKIVQTAEKHIKHACKFAGRDRLGGVLCMADPGGIILVCQIGEVPDADALSRFLGTCQEKVRRLLENPSHFSGWQSRDFDNKKYGGAIRTSGDLIFSFSGLSELLDEAFSALLANRLAMSMGMWRWDEIKNFSNNVHMGTPGYIVAAGGLLAPKLSAS